jgi:hypothetical protein
MVVAEELFAFVQYAFEELESSIVTSLLEVHGGERREHVERSDLVASGPGAGTDRVRLFM